MQCAAYLVFSSEDDGYNSIPTTRGVGAGLLVG